MSSSGTIASGSKDPKVFGVVATRGGLRGARPPHLLLHSDLSYGSDGSDDAPPANTYTEGYGHTVDRKGKGQQGNRDV